MFLLRVRGAFVCFLLRLRGGGRTQAGGAFLLFFLWVRDRGPEARLQVQIKIPWQRGFVRGTAMVDFHIHGRLEKKWFGLGLAVSVRNNEPVKNSGLARRLLKDWLGLAWFQRGWGVWGKGTACPLPPKHTPQNILLRCTILVVFCLCLWSDGTVCTWERLRLQTRLGASCVK